MSLLSGLFRRTGATGGRAESVTPLRVAALSAAAALIGSMIGGFTSFWATDIQLDAADALERNNELSVNCAAVQAHARGIEATIRQLETRIRSDLSQEKTFDVDVSRALRSDETELLQTGAALRLVAPAPIAQRVDVLFASYTDMLWALDNPVSSIDLIGRTETERLQVTLTRVVDAKDSRDAFSRALRELTAECRSELR